MTRLTYDEIRAAVDQLDATRQLRLLEELAMTVRRNLTVHGGHTVLELRGLGKEVWQGIEAQEYVEHERSSWSG